MNSSAASHPAALSADTPNGEGGGLTVVLNVEPVTALPDPPFSPSYASGFATVAPVNLASPIPLDLTALAGTAAFTGVTQGTPVPLTYAMAAAITPPDGSAVNPAAFTSVPAVAAAAGDAPDPAVAYPVVDPASASQRDTMQVDDPVAPGGDDDGFKTVRAKKQARVVEPDRGCDAPDVGSVRHPGLTLGSDRQLSAAGARAGIGRSIVRPVAPSSSGSGRSRMTRRDGVVLHPGPALLLRMSPMEDGQIHEPRPLPPRPGFPTPDGAGRLSFAGPMTRRAVPPVTPPVPMPVLRNATLGPSNSHDSIATERGPLHDIMTSVEDRENIPPDPSFIRDLPPLLRLQTVSYLSRLPEGVRETLIDAVDVGVLPVPNRLSSTYPNDFWPEVSIWLQCSLTPTATANLDGASQLAVADDDEEMPPLAPVPGMGDVAQLPAPPEEPVVDSQNLAVLPNCV